MNKPRVAFIVLWLVITNLTTAYIAYDLSYEKGKNDGLNAPKREQKKVNFSKIFETPRFEWK